jgi:hypothetical protein
MATDYDAQRKSDDDLAEDSIDELKARQGKVAVWAWQTWTRPRSGRWNCLAPTCPIKI